VIFAFVLMCSVVFSGVECQPNTAQQVIRVLDEHGQFAVFDIPIACLRDSQIWAAGHVRTPDGYWLKYTCEHSHPTNQG
jgi:hypothetical protein